MKRRNRAKWRSLLIFNRSVVGRGCGGGVSRFFENGVHSASSSSRLLKSTQNDIFLTVVVLAVCRYVYTNYV